jgi:hypothetical protein
VNCLPNCRNSTATETFSALKGRLKLIDDNRREQDNAANTASGKDDDHER